MFDILLTNLKNYAGNICVSGGAAGSDCAWVRMAEFHGHDAIHFCFKNHTYKGHSTKYRVDVPDDYLECAMEYVRKANLTLSRKVPGPGYVRSLLCRNFYQIAFSDAIYAVANINYGYVEGGTAWAIQMFKDMNKRHGRIYVLNKVDLKWYEWKHQEWIQIDCPPPPCGIWAGIGSREITPEIEKLMEKIWQVSHQDH